MSTDALSPSPGSDADPAGAGGHPDAAGADDPRPPRTDPDLPPVPAWLDEIEGAEALAWVEARNAETLSAYRGGERFELMRRSFPRFGEAASITCFWRFSGIHSNWRKTSVALVPPKPKLLDSTKIGRARV